jgi:hypothetical protein
MSHETGSSHDAPPPGGPTWQTVATGAGVIVLAISGYLFGDTLSSIRHDFREIRAILDARASLPPRVESLEKQHGSFEQRLREMEQWQWQNSPKH